MRHHRISATIRPSPELDAAGLRRPAAAAWQGLAAWTLRLATAALVVLLARPDGLWPARAHAGENGLDLLKALSEAQADLIEAVSPSVVGLRVVVKEDRPSPMGREGFLGPDDFFRDFFGDNGPFMPVPRNRRRPAPGPEEDPGERSYYAIGLGSGIILDAEGHILTNHHVIDNATEIEVSMFDRSVADAVLVASDPSSDIAVIKLKKVAQALTPARLGNSDAVRIGSRVFAIGTPFRQPHSVSSGIVSGKERSLRDDGSRNLPDYERYIQTDAAINPGNSGGPLINLDGEVIGINTIINTRSGGSAGVGFAVPVNRAAAVARQIIEKGIVTRGWLGVAMREVTPDMQRAGLRGGALVQQVFAGGPADQGGMRRGDVIVAVDGQAARTTAEVMDMVAQAEPDQPAIITVMRDGERLELRVVLAERTPELLAQHGGPSVRPGSGSNAVLYRAERLGLTLREPTDDDRKRMDFLGEEGVIIAWVDPAGPGSHINLQRNWLLIEIDQVPVPTLEDAKRVVEALEADREVVLILVKGGGDPEYGTLKLKPLAPAPAE